MNSTNKATNSPALTIGYEAIRDLTFFQEQYDRLTHEIQQVRVQLQSSPSLTPDAVKAKEREEWRSWLQLQIKSKQHARDDLIKAMHAKNMYIENLPE